MSSRGKRKVGKRNEPAQVVDLEAIKAGLPAFWPVRQYIWDLPSDLGPGGLMVLKAARELGALMGPASYDQAVIELECALGAIQAIRPDDAGAIFARLWWLADFLNGSRLDQVSDLLVGQGQSSPDWEAVLQAAAHIPAAESEVSISRARFEAAIEE